MVKIVELSGVKFKAQIEEIKLLCIRFKVKRSCIEKAGLSMQMVEDLKRANGINILEFVPTIDNKAKGFENLLKTMQEGKLVIPTKKQKN